MTIKEAVDKAILEHANKGRDDDTSLSEFICRKLEVLARSGKLEILARFDLTN